MNSTQLERFFQNRANAQERIEVINWLLDPQNDPAIRSWLKQNWEQAIAFSSNDIISDPDVERIWEKIRSSIETISVSGDIPAVQLHPAITSRMQQWTRFTIAAALVGILVSLSYLVFTRIQPTTTTQASRDQLLQQSPAHDITPPKDSRAVLTLADGSQVYLDNSVNGILATQGEVAVKRNERGEIVYTGEADVVAYNTLSIPKGSKPLRLVLADGSLVWLNAASSITYPTAFKGKERRVSMTGEAYFEVTKISGLPFFVDQGQGSIQVLGTQFNVNADAEKGSAKVTLLEGAVKVSNALNTVQILPGQQAQMTANKLKVVDGIDTEEVMSWKNGQFFFTGTDIRDIMKQVEQYYDVEVVFRDEIPYQFVAKISRDVNVSTFLEKLELTNLIHFTIEEKKIIVMK
jgi:ferric-dicitrate binding protein FerR (iron transport regulator)